MSIASLRSIYRSVNPSPKFQVHQPFNSCSRFDFSHLKPLCAYGNQHFHSEQGHFTKTPSAVMGLRSLSTVQCRRTNIVDSFVCTSPNSAVRGIGPLVSLSSMMSYRSYSSIFGGKGDKPESSGVPAASGEGGVSVNDSGLGGNDLVVKLKDMLQGARDRVTYTGEKAKEVSDELTPYMQQLLDSHPYMRSIVVPVGFTTIGTLLAWFVLPRILRRFHKYSMQGPVTLLSRGSVSLEQYPYEKSFWGALEDPVRYVMTFMAFSQLCMMVAPTTIASQYLAEAWKGAVILSFVWFLHRWKTNVFTRALAAQSFGGLEREKLLALDKLSSVGLFAIGIMALAEACGVAVHSIMTVGGIGGVATAFASKDILGNVLSGLAMQFSKPFSIGDTIKAGSIEGQVVEMGLTATSLLNSEKFPVIVPNSLFSSQVIVNKSRAQWRAVTSRIPIQVDDIDKITDISNNITSMLRSHPKVFLEKEAPYCYLSRIESTFAELTIGCNLRHMRKTELLSTEQEILLNSVRIVKEQGAMLGSTSQDPSTQ